MFFFWLIVGVILVIAAIANMILTNLSDIIWINRWTAIGLSFVESICMAYGFGRSGLIPNMAILRGLVIVICLTGGSGLMIFMGEMIKKHGIGNGISIILAVNILSRIPNSLAALFETFVFNKTLAKGCLSAVVILAVIIGTIVLVVILNDGHRDVPVQYSQKMNGRRLTGGLASKIPIKVNVANVMPVIFASSLLSLPQMVASFTGKGYGSGISKIILECVNQNNWFTPAKPQCSIGLVFYIVMIYFFAYFYTSISFNPMEVAANLKKWWMYSGTQARKADRRVSFQSNKPYGCHWSYLSYGYCLYSDTL